MSCLTIDDIIKECLKERAGTTNKQQFFNNPPTLEAYKNSWSAVNAWIESRLGQRKGAQLPIIGSFTWEFKMQDGELVFRPIFVINDSFAKDHHIKKYPVFDSPVLAPCEDINYSKIAIKFSNALTKDMAFFGVRDIMKKIGFTGCTPPGDFVDRMTECEIRFSFGTFKAKERKIKIEFDQNRLSQIMMQQSAIGELFTPDDCLLFTLDSEKEVPNSSSPASSRAPSSVPRNRQSFSAGSNLIEKPATGPGRPNIERLSLDKLSEGKEEQEQLSTGVLGLLVETQHDSGLSKSELPPLSPGIERILKSFTVAGETSPADKTEVRIKAAEKVTKQAYLRCLTDMEDKARTDEELRVTDEQNRKQWMTDEERKKEAARLKAKEIRAYLDDQAAEAHRRKLEEKGESKSAFARFILPDSHHELALQHDREVKEQQKKISHDLLVQSQQKVERKGRVRAEEIIEERDYLDHVTMEMDIDAVTDKLSHLEKQRVLLEAWEKDAHLLNVRKMKSRGGGSTAMGDYIRTNLPLEASMQASSASSTSHADHLNKVTGIPSTFRNPGLTVGYDPRAKR